MKKIICVLIGFIMVLSTGCTQGQISDREVDTINKQLLEVKNEVNKLNNDLNIANNEIEKLQSLVPKKEKGTYFVNASRLNMRLGPSLNDVIIGTLNYGSSINVVDTSNAFWYKVMIDTSKYNSSKSEYEIVYNLEESTFQLKNDYVDNELSFYISSQYLSQSKIENNTDVPIGEKPFVYGLLFYDEDTANLLANEIWSKMKDDLEKLGYTGVRIDVVNRDTYEDDIKNEKFDAVESAPGQFARINKDENRLEAFAKDKIGGNISYSGAIIVNKNSNIVDFEGLKGKEVLVGQEYSESSYNYQKFYLEEYKGINIEKDLKLDKDHYHQEIFYKVATGEAKAGFCGDFVMTNSFGDMKESLAKSNIDLKSEEELEQLRNNVLLLDMSELSSIPNNPHAVKANTFDNKFIDKLYNCVKDVYGKYKEDYDVIEANSKEYEILNQFN